MVPKFKSSPQIDPKSIDAFAGAAETRSIVSLDKEPNEAPAKEAPKAKSPTPASKAPKTKTKRKSTGDRPWDEHDPKADPSRGLNVRLNDFELELVRYLSKVEDRSMQKVIRRLIIPAVRAEVSKRLKEEGNKQDLEDLYPL